MSTIIHDIDIRKLDGSLLLIFRELLARRRTTEVARRLGLSQPAISHALGRLRDLFGDPLFLRKPHGLEPTRRALELGPRIEALIELAQATLGAEDAFDPARSRRCFSIAAPDFVTSLIGPPLIEAFAAEAPGATFVSHSAILGHALDGVLRGEADLALGAFGPIPSGLSAEPLFEYDYCVVARRGHPKVRGKIDLETWARVGHVWFGLPVGGGLGSDQHDREISQEAYGSIPDPDVIKAFAYVSNWETAMLLVASTDAVADCPRPFAERYAARLGLQVLEPPYDQPKRTVLAVRRADHRDLGVDWLLEKVRAALADD
ncbi:MAG: LysR family transcriptional regulator [Maricaulaceae bacterium]|jgi:DNA-binding transcriptional LysR family regulator